MKNARVLVVDDEELTQYAVCRMVETMKGVKLVGAADGGEAAVKMSAEHKPDIVLMDVKMLEMDGVEATKRVLAKHTEARIIGLSAYDDDWLALSMFRAGALGYVLKDNISKELDQAIRCVLSGDYYLSNGMGKNILKKVMLNTGVAKAQEIGALTKRESEVQELVKSGMTSQQIGDRLGIDVRTVETHRYHISKKRTRS